MIVNYRKDSRKTFITIQTDDATSALMLRFLSAADKFAELFHYRVVIERNQEAYQNTKHEKMARARRYRTDLLKRFREIPGSRMQRLRILKEMCLSEGKEITLDRLIATIQVAAEEEKILKIMKVKQLIRKGKSLKDIAMELSITKSTAARYAQAKGYAKSSMLKIVEPRMEAIQGGDWYRNDD